MAIVAIVVAPRFNERHFHLFRNRLAESGHRAVVVGRDRGEILPGWANDELVAADAGAGHFAAETFDAVAIPSGLGIEARTVDAALAELVRGVVALERPVVAIGNGVRVVIDSGVAVGRRVACKPELQTSLEQSGGAWVDTDVFEDGPVLTARKGEGADRLCERLLARLR